MIVYQDVQALLSTRTHLFNTTEFTLRETKLNNQLEKRNREIITTKEKKLLRDRKAFATKKSYRWFNPSIRQEGKLFFRETSNTVQHGMWLMMLIFMTPLPFLLCLLTTKKRRNY